MNLEGVEGPLHASGCPYVEGGETVRRSLRDLFRSHGVEPFRVSEEPAEEEG